LSKKYLVGVGTAHAYDPQTGDLVFESQTEIQNSIAISASAQEIREGYGAQLGYVYYHTSKVEFTLQDAQFNLAFIAKAVGSDISTNNDVWYEENVTLSTGGTGTVLATPLQSPDSPAVYGWVTDANGNTTKVTFTGSNFTLAGGTSGDVVLVRYYKNDSAAQQITVPSNILPGIVRLVIDAQLASSDVGTGILGTVQVEIPRAQFDGTNTLTLSNTGVSNTEIKGQALAYNDTSAGYSVTGVYAKITEIINDSNWYDNVEFLSVADDTITLTSGSSTAQLQIYAVPTSGSAFLAPIEDITFASSASGVATVSSSGLVTRVTSGSANVSAVITDKSTVAIQVDVTCS